jgi:hypothetical protein
MKTARGRASPVGREEAAERRPYQSQSHISTDGQSASLSWCRAPFGTHDQMLSLRSDHYSVSCLVAFSLTKGPVCHLVFVMVLDRFMHIYI